MKSVNYKSHILTIFPMETIWWSYQWTITFPDGTGKGAPCLNRDEAIDHVLNELGNNLTPEDKPILIAKLKGENDVD